MRCWRIDVQRKLSLYLSGELETDGIKRVEAHLLDCGPCRTRLAHLRNGHRLALELPRLTPRRDPWAAIEAAIAESHPAASPARAVPRLREYVLKPGFALAVLGIVALVAALLVASNRGGAQEEESAAAMVAEALDLREFHTVNIADIELNQKPHVVTEGYVSEVSVNDEDGDLSFKLVDDLGQPGPFIICEIIDPIRLNPPSVGSRVRVYGVSRYDGQADHNWYEVHPVLNIELVHR